MRFGVAIPNCREGKVYRPGFTSPTVLIGLATAAEELGYHSLWANDLQSTFDEQLGERGSEPPNFFEALTTIAYLAARTERIRFLTSAITSPLRDPILMAKQVATLDVLSEGRFALGLGLGGKRTEFDRLRGRFSKVINRGRWLDESLALMTSLLTESRVDFDGEFFSVSGAEVYPKPVQEPLPIYLTGAGDAMLARAARYGSGWIHMHITPEQLVERIAALQAACTAADANPEAIEICLQFDVLIAPTREEASRRWEGSPAYQLGAARGRSSETSHIVGTPADLVRRLKSYEQAGMQHVGLIISAENADDAADQMALIAEHVIPAFTPS